MNSYPLSVLLVGDEPASAQATCVTLAGSEAGEGVATWHIEWAPSAAEALTYLGSHIIDVLLLDLPPLQSHGLEALLQLRRAVGDALVLVLSNEDDEDAARQAALLCPHESLPKCRPDVWLPSTLCYLLARRAAREASHEGDRVPPGLVTRNEAPKAAPHAADEHCHAAVHHQDRVPDKAVWRGPAIGLPATVHFLRPDGKVLRGRTWTPPVCPAFT
ncbi:hypothetical protein [Niveibacterium sp. SC-1]|uniref:hypothetical protein n=1 Tax=Niveibacterium sp. SC-1 TaxID=3135646 RepID=UPI00311DA537